MRSATATILIANGDADDWLGFSTGHAVTVYDPLGAIANDLLSACDSAGNWYMPAGACAVVKRFADDNAWEPLRFMPGDCAAGITSGSSSGDGPSGSGTPGTSGPDCACTTIAAPQGICVDAEGRVIGVWTSSGAWWSPIGAPQPSASSGSSSSSGPSSSGPAGPEIWQYVSGNSGPIYYDGEVLVGPYNIVIDGPNGILNTSGEAEDGSGADLQCNLCSVLGAVFASPLYGDAALCLQSTDQGGGTQIFINPASSNNYGSLTVNIASQYSGGTVNDGYFSACCNRTGAEVYYCPGNVGQHAPVVYDSGSTGRSAGTARSTSRCPAARPSPRALLRAICGQMARGSSG